MRSSKAYPPLISLVLISCCLFGQSTLSDSLEQKLPSLQGEMRVDALNKLTYEFITIDNAKVLAYNDEARRLSKEVKYLKGEARAYTYLGVHEYLSGQLSKGHLDLNKGLHLAKLAGDNALRGYTLLQLGNCSLDEVEMDSALNFFKQSRMVFKDSADPVTLSKIYRNIGALYGQRYQIDSQFYYFDQAIRIRRLLPNKTLLIEALVSKTNSKISLNEFVDAQQLLREAASLVSSSPQDQENYNDIRHMEALMLFHKGEFDKAVVLFDSARNYYFKKSLLRKYTTLLIDLGKVFTNRGEYELALSNLYDALRLSQVRHFETESSIIQTQIGWIYQHLGNTDEALRLADKAMSLNPKKLLRADLADALTLKGVVLTDIGQYRQAQMCLDSVLHIFSEVGSIFGKSETLARLAFLEEKRGALDQSILYYKESARLASVISYNYRLAWSYWGLGNVYFKLHDFKNSTLCLDQSQKYAKLEGSNDIMILNYTTRRDLLIAQNRFQEALGFSVLASQLRDSVHRADVTRRFINLAKIEEIEQSERTIQVLQKDKELAQNKISLQQAMIGKQSALLIGGLVGLLLLGTLLIVYYRFYLRIKALNVSIISKNAKIEEQTHKLTAINYELKSLYDEVSEQNEEIKLQADELSESNKTIVDINRDLEKIVEEKTTELKKTNEELIKHNSELLQFSYTVSHNFRGPVARLLGLVDLVTRETRLTETKYLSSLIGKSAIELDLIIKDLSKVLDLRNDPHLLLETVHLQQEWDQSKSLLQDSLQGDELIVTNFTSLASIRTVKALLQSIFYNLLSNAIKYRSPERGLKVIVSSWNADGKAVIEIADNGLGFDIRTHQEDLFKLHKRFHTHVEGRGLGLYLIKAQIDVLHGVIEVTSEPDKGSVFRIKLPLSENTH